MISDYKELLQLSVIYCRMDGRDTVTTAGVEQIQ